jgi:hypothetical protein
MEEDDNKMSIDHDKALDAIDADSRLPTLPDITPKNLPTLDGVFGRGSLGQLQSFGGRSLGENMKDVQNAIEKTRELTNVYNRNHTEWTRRMINMEYYDPWMNMRQISAEMSSRRGALNEAKYRHLENEVKLRRYMRKLEEYETKLEEDPDSVDELDVYSLRIKIAKIQDGIREGLSYIEGAMKEVLILENLYEDLKNQIHDFSEEDWEKHNARAHLRMAISQSLRDVRGGGSISKGEQRLLEQIGVNPGKLQHELREFVEKYENNPDYDDISIGTLNRFICETAEKLLPVTDLKSEIFGFNPEPKKDYMYLEKIGKLLPDDSGNKGTE